MLYYLTTCTHNFVRVDNLDTIFFGSVILIPWELWDKNYMLPCDLLYTILAIPETDIRPNRLKFENVSKFVECKAFNLSLLTLVSQRLIKTKIN